MLAKLRLFLKEELCLDLSQEKTVITRPTSKAALFLGTQIRISSHSYFHKGDSGQRQKAVSQIILIAPLERIFKKLASAGLMDISTKLGTPRFL